MRQPGTVLAEDDGAAEALHWAASGAMALTGRRGGPPELPPGRAATLVLDELARLGELHPDAVLPGVGLLGERAAAAGLSRNAPWSCGGAFRVIPTTDGRLGLSLPRESDLEMLPALVEGPVCDPWQALARWAAETTTHEAVERAMLLGLAVCAVPETDVHQRDPVLVTAGGPRRQGRDRPLVVDFTSLWAGPLAARLLSSCGADVIKVESTTRLDGARRGPGGFYDLLHEGHASVTVDFADGDDRRRLAGLLGGADLVLESSRPRALSRLGIEAVALVDAGVTWLSITAHGRGSTRVGFGDDVAVGAGLLTADLAPAGDALADPLTGVVAARCAAEALTGDRAVLLDVSMHHVAAATAHLPPAAHEVGRTATGWWVESAAGRADVVQPTGRQAARAAAPPGADNDLLSRC